MLNDKNNMISPTIKTYWPGKVRIIADIFWCLCITLLIAATKKETSNHVSLLPTSQQIQQYNQDFMGEDYTTCRNLMEAIVDKTIPFFGSILCCFFMFFFWSWNSEHVKCS